VSSDAATLRDAATLLRNTCGHTAHRCCSSAAAGAALLLALAELQGIGNLMIRPKIN